MPHADTRWDSLDDRKYWVEGDAVAALLADAPLDRSERAAVAREAVRLVEAARSATRSHGVVESFLREFSLGTEEGIALMCLAEALLRTPDAATRDRLIAEKVAAADWASHIGKSDRLLVNAASIGLSVTGSLLGGGDGRRNLGGAIKAMAARLGEPVIRQAVAAAVRMMGEQFVLGKSIAAALTRAQRERILCSFDMLGEGARTEEDAARYETAYADAIEAVGKARGKASGPEQGHGVSVKLSALCSRYEAVQEARVWETLYPRLRRLAIAAARHDLNLAIDAEEADRLVLSLKLIDRLARDPELADWRGLGVVVQAYQKRARDVIGELELLARATGRRLMVRLVKGAYWDSEVKRAQIAGRPDYPVFTTKAATDVSYLACARRLIAAAPSLYPQFATHNAHTLAAVRVMAEQAGTPIEHQRLHGMGETLYAVAGDHYPVRVYAPVGSHEELLPYLVRRLLENGANSSFVHALLDGDVPAEAVAADPITALAAAPGPHAKIPSPAALYGEARDNPGGRDFSITAERRRAAQPVSGIVAGPIVGGRTVTRDGALPVTSPADTRRIVGQVTEATDGDIDAAAAAARAAQPMWDAMGGDGRAEVLRAMADALESEMDRFVALLAAEAGKTLNDGVSEVREAVDFCRYYATLAERQFGAAEVLPGPAGERNTLELHGRGTFLCISPWNFPLAIFTGQIAAALAAGNAVLAKPAEQTPLVAAEAVRLYHRAGLSPALLALLPGDGGRVGAALVRHPLIDGVAFTGGTETAWAINRALAERRGPILPFIAETGGLNGMFVDTTALPEQVVDDAVLSAFGSAGQRCSALRVLFLPEETADGIVAMIAGAMDQLTLGDPADPATDVGPVIDPEARAALEAHADRLAREATVVRRLVPGGGLANGHFFGPVLAEIAAPDFLEREVFGPILHVYRYRAATLEADLERFAARGYGLTLGVHSRIQGFVDRIRDAVPAGNAYVNRSITGAVVGVQPFGGEGLSGTGPKAGGPHALLRYAVERAVSVNLMAQGGDPALLNL